MNGASTEGKRWFIWIRVSGSDQHAENQEPVLRKWAGQLGGTVVDVYITEDSASQAGKDRKKGREFEARRSDMYNRLRRGDADGVLVWALDRISRLGAEDLLRYLRMLAEDAGADVRSYQDPWLNTVDPFARAILIPLMATLAEFESKRRSERIKLGMERRRRDIEAGKIEGRMGGRKKGSGDKRKRSTEGYKDAWAPGGALRVAREQQLAAKRAAEPEGQQDAG